MGSSRQWQPLLQFTPPTIPESTNQGLKKQPKLGLLEILGSGRSDPFSTYPIENLSDSLHELMDFDMSTP
jgi:hypothetical protein